MTTQIRVRVQAGLAAAVPVPVASPVTSVAGRTGAVVLAISDVTGLSSAISGKLDNTDAAAGALIAGASGKVTPVDGDSLALSDSAAGAVLKKLTWANLKAALSGIFAKLSGIAGGQTLIGGTAASENLTLQSTSHATRGKLLFGSSAAYDEVNVRLGVGTQAPSSKLHVIGTTEQERLGYDASNYYSITVSSGGTVTHDATGGQYSFKATSSTATLGSELVTNGTFASSLSGWTDSGSSWSWSSGAALHTSGSASTLSQPLSGIVSGTTYQIDFTITGRTAGTISVALGSVSIYDFGSTSTFSASAKRSLVAADTGSVNLVITPSSTFDGSVDNVSIKAVTLGSISPTLIVTDSGSATSIEFRAALSATNCQASGRDAGRSLCSGANGTVLYGFQAGYSGTNPQYVTAIGYRAAYSATNAQNSVCIGSNAAYSLTNATGVTAIGPSAAYSNQTGNTSTCIGSSAGYANVTNSGLVAVGGGAARNMTTAANATAIGNDAGRYIADGSTSLTSATTCVYIGAFTKASADAVTNENVFGYNATGIGSNSVCIGSSAVTKCQIYGDMILDKTITAAGTTGAQTINKTIGSVNFAAGATSLVVTNNRVSTTSVIYPTVASNDATMKYVTHVKSNGSFTLYANAAPTAETRVDWIVLN